MIELAYGYAAKPIGTSPLVSCNDALTKNKPCLEST